MRALKSECIEACMKTGLYTRSECVEACRGLPEARGEPGDCGPGDEDCPFLEEHG